MFVPIRSVVTKEKCLSLQFSEMLDRVPVGSPTYTPLCSLAGAQTNSTVVKVVCYLGSLMSGI